MKTKILFMAESVTLAHVARLIYLAQSLNLEQFEVHFATSEKYKSLVKRYVENFHGIICQDSDLFLKKLDKGISVLDQNILEKQVEEDLGLLKKINPDVVIGDFRLSLSISARLFKTPYINVTNAYWADLSYENMPYPEIPIFRMLGERLSKFIFVQMRKIILPKVLNHMIAGMNKVREKYNMPSYINFFDAYLDSDLMAFADDPMIVPNPNNSKYKYIFLGPLLGNLFSEKPEWWDKLANEVPIVYLNLGSSGNLDLLPKLIKELTKLPIQIVVGGIDGENIIETYPNEAKVFKAKYLPSDKLCEISKVVILNGGSPSAYQALNAGKPIIGITRNMDQVLNMKCLQGFSFVRSHNGWSFKVEDIRKDVEYFLENEAESKMAREYQTSLLKYSFKDNFLKALAEVLYEKNAKIKNN